MLRLQIRPKKKYFQFKALAKLARLNEQMAPLLKLVWLFQCKIVPFQPLFHSVSIGSLLFKSIFSMISGNKLQFGIEIQLQMSLYHVISEVKLMIHWMYSLLEAQIVRLSQSKTLQFSVYPQASGDSWEQTIGLILADNSNGQNKCLLLSFLFKLVLTKVWIWGFNSMVCTQIILI